VVVIGLRELRQHASEPVRRVEAGEEMTITVAGRPSARLVPGAPRTWRSWDEITELFHGPATPAGAPTANGSTTRWSSPGPARESGPGHQRRPRIRHRPPLPGELAISAATVAELHFGVLVAGEPDVRAERLRRLAVIPGQFQALPIDDAVAASYGHRAAAVVAAGRRPRARVMDLLIAATAHAHEARLYTRTPPTSSEPTNWSSSSRSDRRKERPTSGIRLHPVILHPSRRPSDRWSDGIRSGANSDEGSERTPTVVEELLPVTPSVVRWDHTTPRAVTQAAVKSASSRRGRAPMCPLSWTERHPSW
jgi:prevent-host-death family protein